MYRRYVSRVNNPFKLPELTLDRVIGMKKNQTAGIFLGILVLAIGLVMLVDSIMLLGSTASLWLLQLPLFPILVIGLGVWVLLNTLGYGCCTCCRPKG